MICIWLDYIETLIFDDIPLLSKENILDMI